METKHRAISPVSHVSLIQEDEEFHPRAVPMRIYRPDPAHQMPPWLREAVAERKRQLNESRQLDEPSKLTEDHFGIRQSRFDYQNELVSEWLEGLPEKLVEGWETMLGRALSKRSLRGRGFDGDHGSLIKHTSIIFEGNQQEQTDHPTFREQKSEVEQRVYDDPEDEYLEKVLLGRKRLMQAEISVKRLKMGLKHVASGLCQDFGEEAASGRTRDLLAAVDTSFEEVVRSRLSTVTASRHCSSEKESFRGRLERLRAADSRFMGRIYSVDEVAELKTRVAEILRMDEQSGDTEGKEWFLRMLPSLLELREDMAQAEKEVDNSHTKDGSSKSFHTEEGASTPVPKLDSAVLTKSEMCEIPVWDLYYHQSLWLRSEFGFQPTGPWEAFDISPEEEMRSADWELRIEQRIWLQNNFGLLTGARLWNPFRFVRFDMADCQNGLNGS